MAVLLFERRFWKPVVSGDKVHTIRGLRKRPIVPGNALSLRGWEGKAYRSPQRVLCDETCLFIRECWIDRQGIVIDGIHRFWWDEPEGEAFAKSDGFESAAEMRGYWKSLPFSGELIQWGVHPLLADLQNSNDKLRVTK